MKQFPLFGVVAILCIGADAPKDKASEQDKLQGRWQAVSGQTLGKVIPAEVMKKMFFVFKDNRYFSEADPTDDAIFKTDASKKPAEIDLTVKGKVFALGIYRFIDKDTLEICLSYSERPKEFAAPKESKQMAMLLKRANKLP